MAIKWKNIKMEKIVKKVKEFLKKSLKRNEIWLILGIAGCILGYLLLTDVVSSRYMPTEVNIQEGGFMNLCFAAGFIGLLRFALYYEDRNWNLQSKDFFQEWERKQKKWKIFLGILAGGFLIAAVFYFNYRLRKSWMYGNLSGAYVSVGTVLIQWMICNFVINLYMKKKLQAYMESLEQINQKNLELALRSEQMKVDLISNVSHDLKTPLTSMVGYLELMKKEELTDILSDYVEVIFGKAQKLKEMIDSLFDLAKTSSGNVELKMETLELNCLIQQVQADMADKIAESGREFVVVLTKESTEFVSDNVYMYRIFQNLLENALKYSQEHTRIFLKSSLVEEGKRVRFEITNTAGYPMDFTKEQIVERFGRGDKSRTTEGNGLGLAIVNTYTSALGGTFDVSIDCDQFKASVEFLKYNAFHMEKNVV
ncbi:MAG: HAMP domain-containing histidine kinase [Lachnospiraceae bacterium]|nr:HAMP domain-containing histidine kinase [Lachnospiraceae bacterium]